MPLNPITGTDDDDNLQGTDQRDLIHGLPGDDWIVTAGGHDTVFGDAGNDSVFAYFGDEVLFGGDGDDQLVTSNFDSDQIGRLFGGAGNDRIFAGDRVDHSHAGAGDDTLTVYFHAGGEAYGGTGTDTLFVNLFFVPADARVIAIATGSDAGVRVGTEYLMVTGFEALQITTLDADDYVRGGALGDSIDLGIGANTALGMEGDDFIAYRSGVANFLDGGAGVDALQVTQTAADGALLLEVTGTTGIDGHGSHLTNFESWFVFGGDLGDVALLGAGEDIFSGRGGNDTCFGKAGRDRLVGDAGQDHLFGGKGGDILVGGAGIDLLNGGGGADGFYFGALDRAGDTIQDFQTGEDQIVIRSRAFDQALADGPLDDALFHLENAVGTGGQFIYRANEPLNAGDLIWDANGTDAGGEVLIAHLLGTPDLLASDILIL